MLTLSPNLPNSIEEESDLPNEINTTTEKFDGPNIHTNMKSQFVNVCVSPYNDLNTSNDLTINANDMEEDSTTPKHMNFNSSGNATMKKTKYESS